MIASDSLELLLNSLLSVFEVRFSLPDRSFTHLRGLGRSLSVVIVESFLVEDRIFVFSCALTDEITSDDVIVYHSNRRICQICRHDFLHLVLRRNVGLLERVDMCAVHELLDVLLPLDLTNVAIKKYLLFITHPVEQPDYSVGVVPPVVNEEVIDGCKNCLGDIERLLHLSMLLAHFVAPDEWELAHLLEHLHGKVLT